MVPYTPYFIICIQQFNVCCLSVTLTLIMCPVKRKRMNRTFIKRFILLNIICNYYLNFAAIQRNIFFSFSQKNEN